MQTMVQNIFLKICTKNNQIAQGDTYGSQWKLLIDKKHVTQSIDSRIINHIHGNKLKEFMIKKGRVGRDIFNLINWEAMQAANSKLTIHKHIWLTKHVSKFASVGRNMKRRGKWKNRNAHVAKGLTRRQNTSLPAQTSTRGTHSTA